MLSLDLVFEVLRSRQPAFDPAPQAVVRALATGVNEGASCLISSLQLGEESRSHLEHDSRASSAYPVDTSEDSGAIEE